MDRCPRKTPNGARCLLDKEHAGLHVARRGALVGWNDNFSRARLRFPISHSHTTPVKVSNA